MTWHLKDREVEKALIKLCPIFVDRLNWAVSSKEMGKNYVCVSFERIAKDWIMDDCELTFWMEELEFIDYNSHDWNEYPEIKPRRTDDYLITIKRGRKLCVTKDCYDVNEGEFETEFNTKIIAWKELPEPYKSEG